MNLKIIQLVYREKYNLLNQKTIRITYLVIHLFLANILFAQPEQNIKLNEQGLYMPIKISPLSVIFDSQLIEFDNATLLNPTNIYSKFNLQNYQLEKLNPLKDFSFKLEKKEVTYIGLGHYEHFKNNFTYLRKDKLLFNLEVGLAKQSTILNSNNIDFHFSFMSLIEYKITKSLSAYIYGQYLTSPLNKTKTSFNDLSYMSPLFLQTEIGAGLRANYKNINADVGMKSMYDTQFNQLKPINSMSTKITIGF